MTSLLETRIKANPPRTQEEACRLAARQSIASFGVKAEGVRDFAEGLARGLFGEAFDAANDVQRTAWIDMMEREYRSAANL